MKNAIVAAAFATALATPSQSDAIVLNGLWGEFMCDGTDTWACCPELRPSNQSTPAGVLQSTRLRIEECNGVIVQSISEADAKKPKRVLTYATGVGAAACLPEAAEEVNRELRAYAIKCRVAFAAAPTKEQPSRFEVSASCDGKGK